MEIKKVKQTVIEETTLGIYVWEMPDGRWIGDDEGNYLSIASHKGNKANMAALAAEVASFGIDVGQPKFLSNRRKIDDEQFEYQKARLEQGLIPDPFDIGNYKDELAAYNKKNPAIGGPGR
jgi:hypothetical protein